MLCALIMAGGKGTRFWPLSTEERPKQFLNLVGKDTMLQMTVNRIKPLIPIERIFICTGEKYLGLVREQVPELPETNIIIEPEGRNTAPCIALSAMIISRYYKDASMVVLPSDHIIKNEDKFLDIIDSAQRFLINHKDAIITLGMKPDRPETGYGYIKYTDEKIDVEGNMVIKVDRFVEKPDIEKAIEYLKEGNYLWNGGMFLWTVENIIEKIEKYLPNTFNALREICYTKEDNLQIEINESYGKTDAVSIDYGIMEKVQNIYVIPSDIGWDDVGNWTSIERYSAKDNNNNVVNPKCFAYNSTGNIALTNKKVLLNNVSDLIVVETDEYIMISTKKDEQEIKKAKELIG